MSSGPFAPRTASDRLILPLDVPTVEMARALVKQTHGVVGVYKIGMELQFAGGLELARDLACEGHSVFLDVKLLDIDNTIFSAVRNAAKMGVRFMTIHAYPKTMRAAVNGLKEDNVSTLCLLGVTVLTSMDDHDLHAAGYQGRVAELVARRAEDAKDAEMGGIVCSAHEAKIVRSVLRPDMVVVTPGIRPSGRAASDQKRIMTPGNAIKAGSDYLVIGRPISRAPNPLDAAKAIVDEIETALADAP